MDEHISLSPDLIAKIEHEAMSRGISITDFVRESLEQALARKSFDDPLFTDRAVFRDDGPDDVAARHDDYLYGDAS